MTTSKKAVAVVTGSVGTLARVLVGINHVGINVGELVKADAKVIANMAAAGMVDDHPEAVEYALSQGAAIKTLHNVNAALEISTDRIAENATGNQGPPDTGNPPDPGASNNDDNTNNDPPQP